MSTAGPAAPICRYHEIVVHITPFSSPALSEAPDGGASQRYHAWIYTNLALSVKIGGVDASRETGAAPPPEVGGLPLIGHEEIAITWPRYDEYLFAFYGGKHALLAMRRRIFRQLSGGLRALLQLNPHRLRIWWSIEAPGLEDLPWELIWLRVHRRSKLSVVRGSPGRSAPPLPLAPGRPLRVAVIDPASDAPDALGEALKDLGPGVEVVTIEQDDPYKAFSEAIRAEVEVVHVVADGVAPLELEGLLEFSGNESKRLSPKELAAMVRGSRITIVSLTPPETPRIGLLGVPTVFRAFARFGHDSGDGPTIATQLGPMPPLAFREFWRAFYDRLAAALDVEDALTSAARRPLITPVVLFLRHRSGRQFSRQGEETRRFPTWPTHGAGRTSDDVPLTPSQVIADLSISRELLDTLRKQEAFYASLGLDFPGKSLVESERRRLAALEEALDQSLSEDPKP